MLRDPLEFRRHAASPIGPVLVKPGKVSAGTPSARPRGGGSGASAGVVLFQASFATDFTDTSPSARIISPQNGAAVSGGAAVFDGVNDFLNVSGFADLALGTRNFIFDFEALRTTTAANQIVLTTATDGSVSAGWWTQFDGTSFSFWGPGSSNLVSAAAVNGADGVWHKWTVQRSGNTFTLKKDNTLIATGTSAVSLPASRFSIGGTDSFSGFAPWFQGQLRNMVLTADTP